MPLDWNTRQEIGRYECRHCDRDDLTYREKEKALGILVFSGFDRTEAEEYDPICRECANRIGKKSKYFNMMK